MIYAEIIHTIVVNSILVILLPVFLLSNKTSKIAVFPFMWIVTVSQLLILILSKDLFNEF